MLVTNRKFTLRTWSTINQHAYFSAPIYNRAAEGGSKINAKGIVPGSPFVTSLLHFHRFSLQCIFTESWHVLKITNGQIIQIYTRSVFVWVVYSELFAGSVLRVQCTPSSSLSSSSHSRPHPLELHTFTYPLVREERSKPYAKLIKRVFKLRALRTLKYQTTYFLLCDRLVKNK